MTKKLNVPRIKDQILKYLVDHSNYGDSVKISVELNVPHLNIMSILEQMKPYVSLRHYANLGIKEAAYSVTLRRDGRHFYDTEGYVKIMRKESISNFPKRYWWLIAILTFLIGLFSDIVKEVLKRKILPPSTQSPPNTPIFSDTSRSHKIQ